MYGIVPSITVASTYISLKQEALMSYVTGNAEHVGTGIATPSADKKIKSWLSHPALLKTML